MVFRVLAMVYAMHSKDGPNSTHVVVFLAFINPFVNFFLCLFHDIFPKTNVVASKAIK